MNRIIIWQLLSVSGDGRANCQWQWFFAVGSREEHPTQMKEIVPTGGRELAVPTSFLLEEKRPEFNLLNEGDAQIRICDF